MQTLLAYQAVWALENLEGFDLDGDMEGALDRVLAAGFDGVGVSLGRPARCEAVSTVLGERGKSWEAMVFVRSPDELARALERAQSLGAHHLNVQVLERCDRVSEAVALLQRLDRVAATAELPVHYETHRGRLTNDLLFTVRVLDALPELKLTGDLSHYAVVHEMPLPVPDEDLARMSRVIAQCWAFHGRVAGSHQVQVSICAPQHRDWVQQFRAWWREGFASWMRRAAPDAALSFMSELGPPNYAIVGPDGVELADRWKEALVLHGIARDIWAELKEAAAVTSRPE